MNSRQRVIAAMERKPVDRVPIDFGAYFSTGISVFAYKNLREHLGLDTDNIELADPVQCLARIDDDILEKFHVDTKLLYPKAINPKRFTFREDYTFTVPGSYSPQLQEDGSHIVYQGERSMRMPKNGFFFDGAWLNFLTGSFEGDVDLMAIEAEQIYKETDKFTMFMQLTGLFGNMDFLCDMYTDPEKVRETQEMRLAMQLERAKLVINKMGETIQAIAICDDLGAQNAPLCAPEMYAEFVAPYLKKLCDYIRNYSNYKTFMHTCGSIQPLIPMLIDCGIDAINPVQISANNMDPTELKKKYGKKICFWGGGVDTQNVLNKGSVEEISKNVRDLMSVFGPNSGFVFNTVHNIMGDIEPQKVIKVYETAYKESVQYGTLK